MVRIFDIDNLQLRCKIWFESPDEKQSLLGENKFALLEALHEKGSIKAAAKKCRLEYKTAWDMIKNINDKFQPNQIIVSERGSGGGSSLTTLGIELLEKYNRLNRLFGEIIELIENGNEIDIIIK